MLLMPRNYDRMEQARFRISLYEYRGWKIAQRNQMVVTTWLSQRFGRTALHRCQDE